MMVMDDNEIRGLVENILKLVHTTDPFPKSYWLAIFNATPASVRGRAQVYPKSFLALELIVEQDTALSMVFKCVPEELWRNIPKLPGRAEKMVARRKLLLQLCYALQVPNGAESQESANRFLEVLATWLREKLITEQDLFDMIRFVNKSLF